MASSIQKVSVQVAIDKQAWEDSLEGLSGPQLKKQVAKVKRELSAATRTVGFDRGGLSESQQRGAEKNLQRLKDSDLLTKNEEKRFALAIKIGEAERRIAELRKSATGSAASGSALAETEKRLQTLQDAFVGGGTDGFDIDLGMFESAAGKMQDIVESEKEAVKVADKLASEIEQAFATERKEQARTAKEAQKSARDKIAAQNQLGKQRERSLYKAYTVEQRLAAQAARKRQAAADSLAKQRERALYKEFQQRERLEARAAAQASRTAARGAGGANALGFQDASRRNTAAFQQLIYAAEDAAASTDGLRGALRGAGNNISQFAQLFFAGSPWALGIATAGTIVAQLGLAYYNSASGADEARKKEEELTKAREDGLNKQAKALREEASARDAFFKDLSEQAERLLSLRNGGAALSPAQKVGLEFEQGLEKLTEESRKAGEELVRLRKVERLGVQLPGGNFGEAQELNRASIDAAVETQRRAAVAAELAPAIFTAGGEIERIGEKARGAGVAVTSAPAIAAAFDGAKTAAIAGDRQAAEAALGLVTELLGAARSQVDFSARGLEQQKAVIAAKDVEVFIPENVLDSRAAIGVSDLRSGSELTRLLSGEDGSRDVVELTQRQVQTLEEILAQLRENDLELAE